MRIQSNRSGGAHGRKLSAGLRAEGQLPEFGSAWFAPATEEDVVVAGVDCDGLLFKQNAAILATKWANVHQIVMELGHDVPSNAWKVAAQEVARCGGDARRSAGGTDKDIERVGVDVCTGFCWRDVDA